MTYFSSLLLEKSPDDMSGFRWYELKRCVCHNICLAFSTSLFPVFLLEGLLLSLSISELVESGSLMSSPPPLFFGGSVRFSFVESTNASNFWLLVYLVLDGGLILSF
jgi:hypothetical protein